MSRLLACQYVCLYSLSDVRMHLCRPHWKQSGIRNKSLASCALRLSPLPRSPPSPLPPARTPTVRLLRRHLAVGRNQAAAAAAAAAAVALAKALQPTAIGEMTSSGAGAITGKLPGGRLIFTYAPACVVSSTCDVV